MSDRIAPAHPYVFVSYARADHARALPIVAALQAAGVAVWLDQQDIAGGENYAAEINAAIQGCAALVLLCSAASLVSRNVKQELALAWEYERPYVPLLLELVVIPGEVKYWLTAAQWIEVLDHAASVWLPQVLAALAPLGIAPRSAAREGLRLAGREREQALLRERLVAARGGAGGLVLLGGEAGIGKTTLAEWLLREGDALNCAVLVGRCFDLAETPPYGPFIDLFARYEPLPNSPPLPAAFAVRGTVGAVPSQLALLVQVQDFLAALAGQRATVLLLDDLHWADPASLDLLRFLARALATLPLLVIVTYRADELTRRHPLYALLPQLGREAGAARLDLGRLADDAVRALVAARYGMPDGDIDRLVAYLYERAEGNALFVGELLRALEEGGLLARDGDGWRLRDLAPTAVPALLRQVIDGRLARLDDESRRLLGVAAVIGQEVPLTVWAAAGEADDEALLDLAERAEELHVLAGTSDGAGVRFAHALIREALYESVVPLRRARIHRRVADALLALPLPDPDALVHHLRAARDPRLGHWLLEAGARAYRASAWATAVVRYEEALPLLVAPGDAPARYRALTLLFDMRLYEPASVAYAEEAARMVEGLGDPLLAAFAVGRLGFALAMNGDIATGLADQERAMATLAAHPDYVFDGYTRPVNAADYGRGALAMTLAMVGRLHEARALVQTGAVAYNGYFALAASAALLGEPEVARAVLRDWLAAHPASAPRAVGNVLSFDLVYGVIPYRADDPALVRAVAEAAGAAYARVGESGLGFPPRLPHLAVLLLHGSWDEALTYLSLARRLHHSLHAEQWAFSLYGMVLRARGEGTLARAMVEETFPAGVETMPGALPLRYALSMQLTAAALALDEGDLLTAGAWLDAHDRWLVWSNTVLGRSEGQALRAQYHRQTGDLVQARLYAERALATAREPRQPLALLAVQRLLGEVETDARRFDAAERHLRASLALADACAAPYERALTLLAQAELRAATGEQVPARAALDDARAICESLGAQPALIRADVLAAQLGPHR